jgi:hypothetical protein
MKVFQRYGNAAGHMQTVQWIGLHDITEMINLIEQI